MLNTISIRGLILILSLLVWVVPVLGFELEGNLMQGGLVLGRTEAGAKVFLDGRRIRVSKEGAFVFGFGRDASTKSVLWVKTATSEQHKVLSIQQRDYDEQHIDGLPADKVTPPAEVLARIRKESRLIASVRLKNNFAAGSLGHFIWPTQGRISGIYGSRRILNGQPRRPHYGIDIAAPIGTPVKAPAAGKVVLAYPDMYFSGATMVIDHGYGVSSTFLHLSKFLVKEGSVVRQGQVVAEVGSSGRSTGAHVDWRVNWLEQRLDPQLLVDASAQK